jgi:hypothetical protein
LAVQRQSVPLTWDPALIEVKASSPERGPWADFPPEDRTALRETAFHFNCEPLLAWVTHLGIIFLPDHDWPADPIGNRTKPPRTD